MLKYVVLATASLAAVLAAVGEAEMSPMRRILVRHGSESVSDVDASDVDLNRHHPIAVPRQQASTPPCSFDIGNVTQGGRVTRAVSAKNDSGAPWPLWRLKSSCECLTFDFDADAREVDPGATLSGILNLDLSADPTFVGDLAIELRADADEKGQHADLFATVRAHVTPRRAPGPLSSVPNNRGLQSVRGVRFSADLQTVYVYVKIDVPCACDGSDIHCFLDGIAAPVNDAAQISQEDGSSLLCLVVTPSSPLRRGTRASITVQIGKVPDAPSFKSEFRVSHLWFNGDSQYAYPCRIVSAVTRGDLLALKVYNESTSAKPLLSLTSVWLDGQDVTSACRLPREPLVADRGRYEQDAREVLIPWPSGNPGSHRVELGYRLLPTNTGPVHAATSGTIAVIVRGDLRFPIGCGRSSDLDGSVCVQSDGLRPRVTADVLRRRANQVRAIEPTVNVYARLEEGLPLKQVVEDASFCDFVVVAPSHRARIQRQNVVAGVFEYLGGVRHAGVPFVASIGADVGSALSDGDVRWLCLAALAEGSRGVLVSSPFEETETSLESAPSNMLSGMMSIAQRVTPRVNGASDGIRVSAAMSGANDMLVFLVNEWNTRLLSRWPRPFDAAPREGQRLAINVGAAWRPTEAFDLASGKPIQLKCEDGNALLDVPPFRAGRVVVLRRQARLTSRAAQSPLLPREAEPVAALYPLDCPITNLGALVAGDKRRIAIRIKNDATDPLRLAARVVSEPCMLAGVATVSPEIIPAKGTSEVIVNVAARNAEGSGVLECAVLPTGASGSGFRAFIEASVRMPVRAVPAAIDFGQFQMGKRIRAHEIRFESEKPIASVAVQTICALGDATANAELEFGPLLRSRVMAVRPRAKSSGWFRVAARFDIWIEGEPAPRQLTVPCSGRCVPAIRAVPNGVVVLPSHCPARRTVLLRHAQGAALRLVSASCDVGWVDVLPRSPPDGAPPRVDLTIHASATRRSTCLQLRCVEGGDEHHLRVPIQIISSDARESASPAAADRPASGTGASDESLPKLIDAIDQLSATVRFVELPDGSPNWVCFHGLLLHGSNAWKRRGERPSLRANFARCLNGDSSEEGPFVMRDGKPVPRSSGATLNREHHRNQFLHLLSMAGTPLDAELRVDGALYHVRDLLARSMFDCTLRGDLSKTVSAYTHYLRPGEKWDNKFSEKLCLAAIVRQLLRNEEAFCGGTHRFFALARWATDARAAGDPEVAELLPDVRGVLSQAIADLRHRQRSDGSFAATDGSTGPDVAFSPGMRMIHYTGHSLEWLATALSPAELQDAWVARAVECLLKQVSDVARSGNLLPIDSVERGFEFGFVAHAVSGLNLWRMKVAPGRGTKGGAG